MERARSIEAAPCPLCRVSVVDGRQPPDGNNNNTNDSQQQQENAEGRNNADECTRREGLKVDGGSTSPFSYFALSRLVGPSHVRSPYGPVQLFI